MTFRVICQLSLALLIGGGVGFFGKRALRTSEPTRTPHIDGDVVSLSVPASGSSASVRDTFGGEFMNRPLANIGERLLEHHDNPMTRGLLAVRWAQEDPLGFATFLRTLKRQGSRDGHFRSGLETILYRVWGRMNPEEAFQHALDHPWIENNQFWGLSTVINTCAEQDFDLALQLVRKAGRRLSSYSPGPWLDASPREVIPKISRLPKCMWRGSALDDVYAQWRARPGPEKRSISTHGRMR